MKLRWFRTCDKNGVKSEPELQCWDEEYKFWFDIPYVECKDWEEDEYLHDKNA